MSSLVIRERIWSTRLSALGTFLGLPACVLLIRRAMEGGGHTRAAAFALFSMGMLAMFTASAVYHYFEETPARDLLRKFDYMGIPVMIAGSFTPFCVVLCWNKFGWALLTVIWSLAAVVCLLKLFRPQTPKSVFTGFAIGMGLLGLTLLPVIFRSLGTSSSLLMLFMGAVFITGAVFFNRTNDRPLLQSFSAHDLWHIFILVGSGSIFIVLYKDLAVF